MEHGEHLEEMKSIMDKMAMLMEEMRDHMEKMMSRYEEKKEERSL